MSRSSFHSEHPRRLDVPLLIAAASVALYFGLITPVLKISSKLQSDAAYSVTGGILRYLETGDYFLGLLIFMFSFVFPIVKLAAILWLWFVPTIREQRRRSLRIIEPLGKWSMLDVLVVILFAGAVKLGLIADAEILNGAYIFAGAILLSMIAVVVMGTIAGAESRFRENPRHRSWLLPVLALAGLLLLLAGLFLPLMQVEKWLFWKAEYSILIGAFKLAAEGEFVMALGFFLFVIVLPVLLQLTQVILAVVQLTGSGGRPAVIWLIGFDRWAMTDVFALALFIAIVRLADWTNVTPRIGLYCFAAAIVISPFVSFWLRRLYRR